MEFLQFITAVAAALQTQGEAKIALPHNFSVFFASPSSCYFLLWRLQKKTHNLWRQNASEFAPRKKLQNCTAERAFLNEVRFPVGTKLQLFIETFSIESLSTTLMEKKALRIL